MQHSSSPAVSLGANPYRETMSTSRALLLSVTSFAFTLAGCGEPDGSHLAAQDSSEARLGQQPGADDCGVALSPLASQAEALEEPEWGETLLTFERELETDPEAARVALDSLQEMATELPRGDSRRFEVHRLQAALHMQGKQPHLAECSLEDAFELAKEEKGSYDTGTVDCAAALMEKFVASKDLDHFNILTIIQAARSLEWGVERDSPEPTKWQSKIASRAYELGHGDLARKLRRRAQKRLKLSGAAVEELVQGVTEPPAARRSRGAREDWYSTQESRFRPDVYRGGVDAGLELQRIRMKLQNDRVRFQNYQYQQSLQRARIEASRATQDYMNRWESQSAGFLGAIGG